jgi:hypothetical protein
MKKIIIIAAVIVSSALTAFAFSSKKADTKPVNTLKIDKADFAGKSYSVSGSQLSSAD